MPSVSRTLASSQRAVTAALAHHGPALVDIVTDPRALSLPPAITGEQVKGFALAMSKIVLHGGTAEASRWHARTSGTCPGSEPSPAARGQARLTGSSLGHSTTS